MNQEHSGNLTESLNLLKQLQNKLNRSGKPKCTRTKTQQYQPTSPTLNPFIQLSQRNQYSDNSPPNIHGKVGKSVPTLHEQNQNEYQTVKQILRENKKLKKYVNCLLQMNDYLKNQLISKNQWERKRGNFCETSKMKQSFQLELMRMEIDYLKEANRQKQIELKRSLYLNKRGISSSKQRTSKHQNKNQNLSFFQKKRTDYRNMKSQMYPYETVQYERKKNPIHSRSISNNIYDNRGDLCYPQQQLYMKDLLKSKLNKKSNKRNISTAGKIKKTFKKQKLSKNQCRLCYI